MHESERHFYQSPLSLSEVAIRVGFKCQKEQSENNKIKNKMMFEVEVQR